VDGVRTTGDMITNAMRYLQRCEGVRRDVLLLDETMMTYKVTVFPQPPISSLFGHTQRARARR
jgi:hypothetical protein